MCYGSAACSEISFAAGAAAHKDINAKRGEYVFTPPAWLQSFIVEAVGDLRDIPVAFLLSNILLLTLPAASIVLIGPSSHLLGAAYLITNYALLFPRFVVSLLHVTEHRRLFKQEHKFLNLVASLFLTPFFGIPVGVYKLHHRIMHHVEDNGAPRDLSSTEPYQRNSIPHFLMYWVRHALLAWLELPIYAARCGRISLAAQVLSAEVAYIAAIVALYAVKPTATLWVFILPYFISTLLMMFGNWCQHMFINPECPRSAYGMAYNCVASGDNSMTFNDGYHILHHLNSTTHWSELPARFMNLLQQHMATKALVIEGWGVIDVGLAIFARDYNAVVDRMLLPYHKPTDPAERAAAILMLKERLKPVKMTQAGDKQPTILPQHMGCALKGRKKVSDVQYSR